MLPATAAMSDDEASEWAERHVLASHVPTPEQDNVVTQLRDATLFNFQLIDDIKMFIQLVYCAARAAADRVH